MSTSSTFVAADGAGYELQMGRWSARLAGPFLDFVGTADAERVLDLGCGTGRLAAAMPSADERNRLEAAVRAAYVDGEPDGLRSYAALAWAVTGVVPG